MGCHEETHPKALGQTEEQFAQLETQFPQAGLSTGRRVFLKHCGVCHQASGVGASKAIPPLRGHITHLAAHPLGHSYLARLVLFGLNGPITVNGQKYFNTMPPLGALLLDHELAAALNYALVSWGNAQDLDPQDLIRPGDIAAQRPQRRSSGQNLAYRKELWPDGVAKGRKKQQSSTSQD